MNEHGPYVTNVTLYNHGLKHDDVIKWKHFPRYWPFVWEIHWSPVNSLLEGQSRRALIFICAWMNGRINNREAGDLRRYRAHYDVTVMVYGIVFAHVNSSNWKCKTLAYSNVIRFQQCIFFLWQCMIRYTWMSIKFRPKSNGLAFT